MRPMDDGSCITHLTGTRISGAQFKSGKYFSVRSTTEGKRDRFDERRARDARRTRAHVDDCRRRIMIERNESVFAERGVILDSRSAYFQSGESD